MDDSVKADKATKREGGIPKPTTKDWPHVPACLPTCLLSCGEINSLLLGQCLVPKWLLFNSQRGLGFVVVHKIVCTFHEHIHTCTHAHSHTRRAHTHTHTHTHTWPAECIRNTWLWAVSRFKQVHTCTRTHIHTHAHTDHDTQTCTHIPTHSLGLQSAPKILGCRPYHFIKVHTHTHTHTHTHAHTHRHTHTRTHTHTHTHTDPHTHLACRVHQKHLAVHTHIYPHTHLACRVHQKHLAVHTHICPHTHLACRVHQKHLAVGCRSIWARQQATLKRTRENEPFSF